MANRLTDGRLASILRERRERNQSFETISRELYAEFGVEVTGQTVANWYARLAEPSEGVAS